MEQTKSNRNKTWIIIAIIGLLLLGIGIYTTIKVADASKINEQLDLGNKYFAEQQYDEAIIAFENVLDVDPKHVEARIGLANSHEALTNIAEAKETFVKGIELVPDEAEFYLRLGIIEIINDEVEEGINTLDAGYQNTNSQEILNELSNVDDNISLVSNVDKLQINQAADLQVVYSKHIQTTTSEQFISGETSSEEQEADEQNEDNEASSTENESEETDAEEVNDEASEENDKKDKKATKKTKAEVLTVEKGETLLNANWTTESGNIAELSDTTGSTNTLLALEEGSAIVVATVGSISKQKEIIIQEQVVDEITIEASSKTITIDEEIELKAIVKDLDNKKMKVKPTWSITEGVGSLSKTEGEKVSFSSKEIGNATITAVYDDMEAKIELQVEEEDLYVLRVGKEGSGTVTVSPQQESYEKGTAVTLQASPADGWKFNGWKGSISGSQTTQNIIMDNSKNITAVFTKEEIDEVVVKTEKQAKTKQVAATKSTGKAKQAKTKQVAATKSTGKAKQAKTYKLTTSVKGEGSVKKANDKKRYKQGESVKLTAEAKDGWVFDKWNNGAGSSASINVTMDKNKSYEATFIKAGKLTGKVVDATNSDGLNKVQITLRSGKNNKSGNSVKSGSTDKEGTFTFGSLKPGVYTLEVKATNYVTKYSDITIKAGENTEFRDAITPEKKEATDTDYTVVLTWNERPSDLDSHLYSDSFHVYYGNSYFEQGDTKVELDVDETTGYGPETITFNYVDGTYKYYVHNYSGDGWYSEVPLKNSNAKVELYRGRQLIKTFRVPTKGKGYYWDVFEIKDNEVKTINKIR